MVSFPIFSSGYLVCKRDVLPTPKVVVDPMDESII